MVDWANSGSDQPLLSYESHVAEVRRREVTIVRSRGRLLNLAREFVRLSSLMPFPIQQWYLSHESPAQRRGRFTPGVALNVVVALISASIAVAAPLAGAMLWPPIGWLWLAALPVQILGGALYAATRTYEPGENPLVGTIWRLQIAVIGAIGVATTVFASVLHGRVAQVFGALGWFILGLAFLVGFVIFERVERRRLDLAALG